MHPTKLRSVELERHETTRAEQAPRNPEAHSTDSSTCESARAERLSGKRKRKISRRDVAKWLDDYLDDRWEDHDDSASNAAIARRLGTVEKHVRELRTGNKALPVADLLLVSPSLAEECCRFVLSERRRDEDRRCASELREMRERAIEVLLRSTGNERQRVAAEIQDTIDALSRALEEP